MLNKNILITGSSYGIGYGISEHLSSKGCTLIMSSRNQLKLNSAKKKLNKKNNSYFVCDFENDKSVNELMKKIQKKLNKIDVIICNVGSGKTCKSGDETFKIWQNVFKKNFFSTTNVIENFLRVFKKKSYNTKIIVVGSIAGDFKGNAPLSYSLAKNCLINYVKNIAPILAKNKITINAISPGHVLIKDNSWDKKLKKNKKKVLKIINETVSLKRFCKIEDINSAIKFLISREANYINGINLVIDGKTK